MQAVNKEMNPAEMNATMRAFAMEMEKAGVIQESVMDGFDMMEDPGVNADADDVYNGILGEMNLEFNAA